MRESARKGSSDANGSPTGGQGQGQGQEMIFNGYKENEFKLNLPPIRTMPVPVVAEGDAEGREEEEDDNSVVLSKGKWMCCMGFSEKQKHAFGVVATPIQHEKRRSLVPEIMGVKDIIHNPGPESEIRLQRDNLAAYERVCSQLSPGLFVAGEAVARNRQILQRHNITHIINCVGYVYHEHFKHEIDYLTLYLMDFDHEDITCILYTCFDFIEKAREANGNVLIHCQKGVSRSIAVAVGYLMWLNDESFERVFEKVCEIRPVASPNIGFVCALMKWERRRSRVSVGVGLPPIGIGYQREEREKERMLRPPLITVLRIAPHVREDPLRLVPKSFLGRVSAFDPRFVYLVCYQHVVYIWQGGKAHPLFIKEGKHIAQQMLRYEKPFTMTLLCQQGSEPQSLKIFLGESEMGVNNEGLIVKENQEYDNELQWFESAVEQARQDQLQEQIQNQRWHQQEAQLQLMLSNIDEQEWSEDQIEAAKDSEEATGTEEDDRQSSVQIDLPSQNRQQTSDQNQLHVHCTDTLSSLDMIRSSEMDQMSSGVVLGGTSTVSQQYEQQKSQDVEEGNSQEQIDSSRVCQQSQFSQFASSSSKSSRKPRRIRLRKFISKMLT